MIIATTGYHGTGSSAVLDLLTEYEGCSEGGLYSYEHVPLYIPNGVFDLEHKLLLGNDMHRSDEAIKSFRETMYALNDTFFGWYGSYRHFYGDQFRQLVDRFLEQITQFTCEGEWYQYCEQAKIHPVKLAKDVVKTLIPGKQVHGDFGRLPPKLLSHKMELSYISPEEFYGYAREFIQGYCEMINKNHAPVLLLDHMLFPHNAYKVANYFGEDFRLIVVERDVRDLFTLCKHVWPGMGFEAPYPREREAFLKLWTNLRRASPRVDDPRVLYINFEDLIYRYDETVARIEAFSGLTPEQHIRPRTRFVPERSINNTQNFRIRPEWLEDAAFFESRSEDIYPFPYERIADLADTFDSVPVDTCSEEES